MEALLQRWVGWAERRDDVRAAFVVGSRARVDVLADEFSDLDLIFLCDYPDRYLGKGWLGEIGEPVLSFLEPTSDGRATEHRVLFAPDLDVDFVPLPTDIFERLRGVDASEAARRLAGKPGFTRGVRIVMDKDGLLGRLSEYPRERTPPKPPTEAEYLQVVNDFLFHALWAARKLKRGELWTARSALNGPMRCRCMLPMTEWHARCLKGWTLDTWHDGRFLERWAVPCIATRLDSTFSGRGFAGIEKALHDAHKLFRDIARDVARALAYAYPESADAHVSGLIRKLRLERRRKVK